MHPQLQAVVDEFESAERRLRQLAGTVPTDQWPRRPDPARWSVAECVAHLNLTSRAYLPLLREGLERARRLEKPAPSRYGRDPIGWLLWKWMGPPVRFRVKTAASFVPGATDPPDQLIETFGRLQADQIACVRAADELPLGEVRITSPFNARVKYNLFAGLTMLPPHQHRHLWQAEMVLQALQRMRA